ncbi:hypothetical protein M0R45_008166 [Rubus argutus]|uniref:60S ribosomal protein L7a n=1 Tax=Rubus argutus TaxID=59490 RepID=A0AAW1Y0S0_RUBAR
MQKDGNPYCIVKGKAHLGVIVHKKTASILCLTTDKNEDKMEFSKVLEAIKANFNDKYEEYKKKCGGGIMGSKSQAKTKAKERLVAKEAACRGNIRPSRGNIRPSLAQILQKPRFTSLLL